mmetsp:Transcript_57164/g.102793  ORF Transcript_57164/g.102793 Transcript_57164/m.102793 type:complete len:95 (+) Transcript_57164:327-611(+)
MFFGAKLQTFDAAGNVIRCEKTAKLCTSGKVWASCYMNNARPVIGSDHVDTGDKRPREVASGFLLLRLWHVSLVTTSAMTESGKPATTDRKTFS